MIEKIKELINVFESSKLSELNLEFEGLKFAAKKEVSAKVPVSKEKVEEKVEGNLIKAPIVGTYYSKPAPNATPFIQEGAMVQAGDTLFIIEAMKVMNEIKAPSAGKVLKIYATDGEVVDFDKPLVLLGDL